MELTAAEIEAIGVAREVAANKRMKASGFVGDAAAYERDANRRAIEAGFTSAVDQEIDANRRARRAGFKNAALKENPAAAAPGESIYSTDPFIDPRTGVSTQFSYPQTGGTTTGGTTTGETTTAGDGTTTTDSNSVYTGGNTGNTATGPVVSYGYIQGKWYSFPNPDAARAAIQKFSGNMESLRSERPTGVNIDTSLGWNADTTEMEVGDLPATILPAPGVTGDALWNPPLNPIIRTTAATTAAATGAATGTTTGAATGAGAGADAAAAAASGATVVGNNTIYDFAPWDENLDKDLLSLAQRYADAGMMGRAKQAFEKAGGTWTKDIAFRMKTERVQEGPNYGGQFEFDWANRGITDAADLEKIKAWAKGGLFGKIKQFMESKKAGSYDKDVHVKLKAMTHRGEHDYVAPSTVTKDTAGAYLDTRTGKWRLPAPDGTTPGKATTTTVDPSVYDPSAFKGKIKDIAGKFKTGQPRKHAQTWRQKHMSAAEKKHGIKRDESGKVIKPKSDKAWKAYIAQRNKVAGRHRKLIGAGKKTLKSGAVIG